MNDNVELVFENKGTEVKVDAQAIAEMLRVALCRGDLEFVRVQKARDEDGSGAVR